jgi:hypothetical protein
MFPISLVIFLSSAFQLPSSDLSLRRTGLWHKWLGYMHLAGQINENEVGGACGTHGRGEKSLQGFGGKARRKKTTRKTEA